MRAILFVSALFPLCLAVGAAQAGPAECAAIRNSFAALREIPGYRQRATSREGASTELMVLGNSLYLHGLEGWKIKTLQPAQRLRYLLPDLDKSEVENCRSAGPESFHSVMVQRYHFTLKGPSGGRDHFVLIDLAAGLIRKVEMETGMLELSYDRLMPPSH